jgi:hypothetical protein
MIPRHIYVHHTVTSQRGSFPSTVNSINATHKARKYPRSSLTGLYIGYNYLIGDGWTLKVRNDTEQGAHTMNHNHHGIGVAFVGNFENDKLSNYQEDSFARIVSEVKKNNPIESFFLHREVRSTACPGKNVARSMISKLYNKTQSNDDLMTNYDKAKRIVDDQFRLYIAGRATDQDVIFWCFSENDVEKRWHKVTVDLPIHLCKQTGSSGKPSERFNLINKIAKAFTGKDATVEDQNNFDKFRYPLAEITKHYATK